MSVAERIKELSAQHQLAEVREELSTLGFQHSELIKKYNAALVLISRIVDLGMEAGLTNEDLEDAAVLVGHHKLAGTMPSPPRRVTVNTADTTKSLYEQSKQTVRDLMGDVPITIGATPDPKDILQKLRQK